MGFFDSLGKALIAAPGPGFQTPTYSVPVGEQWSVAKTGSVPEQIRAYESWVYAAVSVVARSVAQVEGHLLTRDDNEIETHPFLDLWARPCRAWRGSEWRQVVVIQKILTGDCFWWIADNNIGTPAALWPLRPDSVEIIPDPVEFIKGYRFTGSTGQVELPAEQVVHLKRPNPDSNYYGLGVVQAARRAVDLNRMMKDYGIASFRNNAVPKALFRMSKEASPDQVAGVVAMIEDSYKGVANANRSGVITNAVEGVDILSMTPQDMDYLQGMQATRDEIFSLVGVHRSKVGMADDINRANAEAADYTFSRDVVKPELQSIQDAINSDILPRFDAKLRWQFDDPVPEDRDRALAEAQALWTGGFGTENEARDRMGMDERPEGEVYAQPFSMTIVPVSERGRPAEVRSLRSVPDAARIKPKHTARVELARSMNPVVNRHEAAIKAAMESYFRAQRKRVMGRLRNELASWPDRASALAALETLGDWIVRDPEKARAGMDEENERRELYALLLPLLIAAGVSGYEYIRRLTDTDVEQDVDGLASERARTVAGIVTATTLKQLIEAIDKAETKADALAAFEAVFDRALNARAPLIGRVESSSMVNTVIRIGAEMAGYAYKQWQTVGDDRVEEVCAENEAAGAIPIDERFDSGDFEPPTVEHPGCRCILVPAMAEDVGVTPIEIPAAAGYALRTADFRPPLKVYGPGDPDLIADAVIRSMRRKRDDGGEAVGVRG